MKERWFNYRPLCLIFGFLLLGSVFSFYFIQNTLVTTIVAILIISALMVLAYYKNKLRYVLVPIIAFIIGVSAYYLSIYNFNKSVDHKPNIIESRIYNISEEKNGMIRVECDNCIFDEKRVNDNITLYIYDNDSLFNNIEIGSIIKFKPNKFYKADLFYHEIPNSSLYYKDLKYTVSAKIEEITYIKTDKNFAESFRETIKDRLKLGFTNENVEIAYSALFGDKDLLSENQYNAYKLSGVAHLLAVSGLHVGIIVAILNYICKKFKIKKWYKFGLIALFLIFYSYLCGFSISIVRASIMSLILLLAHNFYKQYDSLNAISIAGIILFLINPLCVFDVAFLLSFSCVLGITMLNKPILKAFNKTRLPKKVAESLSVSISASTFILFIMAYYFNTLNLISIIANVVLIPIFTIGFVAVFVVSILSILIPVLAYVLYPVNYIFSGINILAIILGNLTISNFNTISFNYIGVIVYFFLLLFMGRFCTAKSQYKIISTLPIVALLLYCLL